VTGSAVYVTSSGQLGVQGSSERFKTDIATMTPDSEKLQQLRPVTFHYKTDPDKVTQYGLIAEEVAQVYPELVIRDDSGKIMGVHYEELAPLLLNEIQRQQRINAQQAASNDAQAREIAELKARADQAESRQAALIQQDSEIRDLKKLVLQMQAQRLGAHAGNELVAQRSN
jgi:hypothetical protein